jgi:hypothetical protein
MRRTIVTLVFGVCVGLAQSASAAERHMMQPRVPEEQLAEARALKNPLPDSPEVIERGRACIRARPRVSTAMAQAEPATALRP